MFCCGSIPVWRFCLPQSATDCSCDLCRPSAWTSLSMRLKLSQERNQQLAEQFQSLFWKGWGPLLQSAAAHLQVATIWRSIWIPGYDVLKCHRMIDWWDISDNELDVSISLSTPVRSACLMRINYWKCSHTRWHVPARGNAHICAFIVPSEGRDTSSYTLMKIQCFTWMCLWDK